MDYSKFYTPPVIADLLVRQLNITKPKEVIDICCGSCNLLHAAKKRWKQAKLLGIDVIKHASTEVQCIQNDGRKFAIENPFKYSLVLANPPFDSINTKNEFPELYCDLPFQYNTSRLEIEMLLANLRILQEFGTLMIIMPSTFVTAESHQKIRAYLAKEFYIERIVHLPEDTFGSAKISSCALVIKRENRHYRNTKRVHVINENNQYVISASTNIVQSLIQAGKWDEIPCVNTSCLKITFRRGNISSHFFVEKGFSVLHTAKIKHPWEPSIRYVEKVSKDAVFAEEGDIIISRIGKSSGQWCKYSGPKVMVSDCLYVVKDTNGILGRKLKGKQYPYPPKGVAVRYITMSDFRAWIETL